MPKLTLYNIEKLSKQQLIDTVIRPLEHNAEVMERDLEMMKDFKMDVKKSGEAHWEKDGNGKYKCSNCYCRSSVDESGGKPLYKYCPYCGSRMSFDEERPNHVEIKPCPFCGEKDDIDFGINSGTLMGFDYVECQTCGAEIHAIHSEKGTVSAIEAWNRRAKDDEPRKN